MKYVPVVLKYRYIFRCYNSDPQLIDNRLGTQHQGTGQGTGTTYTLIQYRYRYTVLAVVHLLSLGGAFMIIDIPVPVPTVFDIFNNPPMTNIKFGAGAVGAGAHIPLRLRLHQN
jgi:hypothetical protein